jgi:hypothetical protein
MIAAPPAAFTTTSDFGGWAMPTPPHSVNNPIATLVPQLSRKLVTRPLRQIDFLNTLASLSVPLMRRLSEIVSLFLVSGTAVFLVCLT